MATRMQQRRGTASQWTDADPILASGEIGFETDTGQFKVGDGINIWSDLSYFKNFQDLGGSFDDYILLTQRGAANGVATLDADGQIPISQLAKVVDSAPDALNTLKELATALGNDSDFANNVTSLISAKAPKENAALIGTPTAPTPSTNDNSTKIATTAFVKAQSYLVSSDLNGINGSITSINNSLSSLSSVTTDITTLGGRVGTLETGATSLASRVTSAEASITTAQGNITTAQSDITTANTNIATITSNLSTHEAKTTNVHGIANTAALATQSYADSAATTAAGTVSTNLTTHTGKTTNVHGIADTTKLVTTDASSQTLSGNLTITGNLTVSGSTTTVSANNLVVDDSLIYLADQNTSSDALDIGIYGAYGPGGASHKHTGLFRDASDSGKWKLISNGVEPTSNVIDLTNVTYDTLVLGALEATSATIGGVAFSDKADKTSAITSQTGSYTIATGDVNTSVEYNSSSAGTFTIPSDNSFWPVGRRMEVLQVSTGQLTIAGGSGVTVNGTPTTKTRTQWSGATIIKRAENTFVIVGDLASS